MLAKLSILKRQIGKIAEPVLSEIEISELFKAKCRDSNSEFNEINYNRFLQNCLYKCINKKLLLPNVSFIR